MKESMISALLDECAKAGYSIVSVGLPCDELPLTHKLSPKTVKQSIFAGPETPRVHAKYGGEDVPAIWAIRSRVGYGGQSCGDHSIHLGMVPISPEKREIYKLSDNNWIPTTERLEN